MDSTLTRYPRLSYQILDTGVHSVAIWKGMLIIADSQGLALSLDLERRETRIPEVTGIRKLEAGQEYLYLLNHDGRIDVLSRNFEMAHSFQTENGPPIIDIAATSQLVGAARGDRVDVYDMHNPNRLAPFSTLEINGAMKISPARLATSKNSFYLHNHNGGGKIIDLSEGYGRVTADYNEDPWFVGTARVGDILARLHSNKMQLELYKIVGTMTA